MAIAFLNSIYDGWGETCMYVHEIGNDQRTTEPMKKTCNCILSSLINVARHCKYITYIVKHTVRPPPVAYIYIFIGYIY